MTTKIKTISYDQILRTVITLLVAIMAYFASDFIEAVNSLKETVTILSTQQKQNEKDLSDLQTCNRNHENRIIILEQNNHEKRN